MEQDGAAAAAAAATASATGARFFDEAKRDMGWASSVTQRVRSGSSMLATFDVVGAGPELARRLGLWDHRPLQIRCADVAATTYRFRWASGYGNGQNVRIQGVLEPK
jgi:hypothetical protein